jgi:hypothetical protein
MNTPTFTTSLIRELRGSPLTVLVALLLLEQSGQVPVTAQLLKDCTGYGDHTLTDSLRALTSPSRQIVVRVPGGWRLAGGFQLPLEIQSENRIIREFEPTTTTALMVESKKNRYKAAVGEEENRELRGFESPDQEIIHRIFHIEGRIGEPMATRLALLPGMDAITAMAHCCKAAMENTETGLLIHRLRMGDGIEESYRRQAQDRINKLYS